MIITRHIGNDVLLVRVTKEYNASHGLDPVGATRASHNDSFQSVRRGGCYRQRARFLLSLVREVQNSSYSATRMKRLACMEQDTFSLVTWNGSKRLYSGKHTLIFSRGYGPDVTLNYTLQE